jgi:hypothetical protein
MFSLLHLLTATIAAFMTKPGNSFGGETTEGRNA